MTSKKYKALFVPEKLHKEVKLRAVKKGMTIIEYLKELLNKVEL